VVLYRLTEDPTYRSSYLLSSIYGVEICNRENREQGTGTEDARGQREWYWARCARGTWCCGTVSSYRRPHLP
jgi:hypothetical protein